MSKKTRKKSPKAASRVATRAKSAKPAKTQSSKSRPAKASKPAKKAAAKARRKPAKGTSESSQNVDSKQLKASSPKRAPQSKASAFAPKTSSSREKAETSPAVKSALAEGTKAPAFRLPRDGGGTVSLSEYAGKKLVLFFYPRADTPGCTKEAIDFTRLSSAFAESQTAVMGVSADPAKAQEAFRDKHQLSTPLVSDEQHQMLEAYGIWGEKSMYGRTFQGVLRTTVLIGADGRFLKIWRNVKVDGHAEEVLAAARAL
jgi:thioredoxin-dependent peroxiredoxin